MKSNGRILVKVPESYPGKRYILDYAPRSHYVYWKHTGHIIQKDEVIHHLDENKMNDSFENLKLMTRGEHTIIHQPKALMGLFKCPVCGVKFMRPLYNIKKQKEADRPVLCSRVCSGKLYGNGRPSHNFKFEVIKIFNKRVADVSE